MSDKDIILTWKGQEYTVKEADTMRLGSQVEDIITLSQLGNPAGPPLFKASMALGCALRFAGCRVTDREIHTSLFERTDAAVSMLKMVNILLAIMTPPDLVVDHLRKTGEADAAQKKPPVRRRRS